MIATQSDDEPRKPAIEEHVVASPADMWFGSPANLPREGNVDKTLVDAVKNPPPLTRVELRILRDAHWRKAKACFGAFFTYRSLPQPKGVLYGFKNLRKVALFQGRIWLG